MASLYEAATGLSAVHLPYRRAALAFMRWQLRRGLLNPLGGSGPTTAGSPWWRAVNERLLRDTAEARATLLGHDGEPSSPSAAWSVSFARRPSARSWYRAHNASVIAAYLDHESLAVAENRVERFFINLVLVRVLYAHALVAAPRLALGWCAPIAPMLGDPRLGMTGIFLSLSRVLPDDYPLRGELPTYADAEHGFGRFLDIGVIRPRLASLYRWSASELGEPRIAGLVDGEVPAYAWDAAYDEPWNQKPSVAARAARRLVPHRGEVDA